MPERMIPGVRVRVSVSVRVKSGVTVRVFCRNGTHRGYPCRPQSRVVQVHTSQCGAVLCQVHHTWVRVRVRVRFRVRVRVRVRVKVRIRVRVCVRIRVRVRVGQDYDPHKSVLDHSEPSPSRLG